MRGCGYLLWSMPSFRWISEQSTGCCKSSSMCSVVVKGRDNPSSASQSIVAANYSTHVMAFPVALQAATPGRRGIYGKEIRYSECGIASSCDPVSGSSWMVTVGPYGCTTTLMATDSSLVIAFTCWTKMISTIKVSPSHTDAK